jgi:uracil-DNA glycosylase
VHIGLGALGKPVPSFRRPHARVLIVGLAPAAHGEPHRTDVHGRPFRDFLHRALHASGFASQPFSRSRDDGPRLRDAYITAATRCTPANKPLPIEIRNCRRYLERNSNCSHE